jgi:hypothetical protein
LTVLPKVLSSVQDLKLQAHFPLKVCCTTPHISMQVVLWEFSLAMTFYYLPFRCPS